MAEATAQEIAKVDPAIDAAVRQFALEFNEKFKAFEPELDPEKPKRVPPSPIFEAVEIKEQLDVSEAALKNHSRFLRTFNKVCTRLAREGIVTEASDNVWQALVRDPVTIVETVTAGGAKRVRLPAKEPDKPARKPRRRKKKPTGE